MQLISPSSMTTTPSANNNHRHNVPSTTTNCQTTSQASNQLSTSYAQIQIPKVQQSPVQMPFSPPQNHLNK